MKISVIVPVYNGAKYIAQCLDNVLAQTFKDLEIVVVDDGSTDGTADIVLRDYPSVRLVSQPNRGAAAARNAGLDAAQGEFFHFIDVDDLINRKFYESMVAALDGVDADMAFCSSIAEFRPEHTQVYDQMWVCSEMEDKFTMSRAKDLGYSWRYLCRREFVREHGLRFPEGKILEDLHFTLQAVYHARRVVSAPGAVYFYKLRPGSVLNSRDKAHMRRLQEDWRQAMDWRRNFLAEHGLKGRTVEVSHHWRISILGIPLMHKRMATISGRVNYYLLGVRIFQIKRRDSTLRPKS